MFHGLICQPAVDAPPRHDTLPPHQYALLKALAEWHAATIALGLLNLARLECYSHWTPGR